MHLTVNRHCSFPLHTFLTDTIETCGGSSRLVRLLNRLGGINDGPLSSYPLHAFDSCIPQKNLRILQIVDRLSRFFARVESGLVRVHPAVQISWSISLIVNVLYVVWTGTVLLY